MIFCIIALIKVNDLFFYFLNNVWNDASRERDMLFRIYAKYPDYLKKQAIMSYRKYAITYPSTYLLLKEKPENFSIPDDVFLFCLESEVEGSHNLTLECILESIQTNKDIENLSPALEKKLLELLKRQNYFSRQDDFSLFLTQYALILLVVKNYYNAEMLKEIIPLLNEVIKPREKGGSPIYEFSSEPTIYGSHLKMGGKPAPPPEPE